MVPRRAPSRLTHHKVMLTPSIRTFAFTLAATLIACGQADNSQTSLGRPGSQTEEAQFKGVAPAPAAPPTAGSIGGVAGRREVAADVSAAEPQGRDPSQVPVTDSAATPSMLIRTGNATIEVDSLEIAMQQIRDLAQRLGGFVANVQLSSGQDQVRSASLEMKIPVARWSDAVSGLKPVGKVEALNEFTAGCRRGVRRRRRARAELEAPRGAAH